MTRYIYIKTNRTKSGIARAKLTRFVNYSIMRYKYAFRFYKTYKFFDTYKELKEYLEQNYIILDVITLKPYTLPEHRKEFFN